VVPHTRRLVGTTQGAHVTWLVIGSRGQLGTDLLTVLGTRAVGLDIPEIDITDPSSVATAIRDIAPDVVINCAAFTAVDAAEGDEATALAINGNGVGNIVAACRGARLVQISTDYVFDGTSTTPYAEDATPDPRSAYGRTKLAGERAALSHPNAYVLRTAWLYGAHGQNFVKTMLRLERTRETVSVVDDQVGQPTWSMDLARQIDLLVRADAPNGIYHATNAGRASWYEFARAIFEGAGADPDRVVPTTTAAFPRSAPRPANSVLGHQRWAWAGLEPMRPWDDALAEALPAILASAN
jgi:dTDP-4-dehydrorhamnose reductase